MKASRYIFRGSYRQWETTWEHMLYDGKYLTDDEFLSHFCVDRSCVMQLNSLVENDQEFIGVYGAWQEIIDASCHGVAEVLR